MLLRSILITASCLLVSHTLAVGQTTEPPEPVRLDPGDAIRLVVEDEPDLSGDFPVATDGRVLLPMVGGVDVAGRAFTDVEREVRERLARELAERLEVQVTPAYRVSVLGEVRVPGVHMIDPTLGLSDVLAMAGGFLPSADRDSIQLIRDGLVVLEMDQEGLASGGPTLRPGDRVVVGRVGWFRENLGVVIGAAGSLAVAVVTGLIVR